MLQAAAELFAERGFDQTTVRDVAARAEVNQALLFRYFGSKQELFAEVLSHNSAALLDSVAAPELPRRILENVLADRAGSGTEHTIVAMLRSLSDERAARVLRDELGGSYVERLARLSDAEDADLRADLVLAWLFGIGMMRSVLGKDPLAEASEEVIIGYVTRAVSFLLEKSASSEEGD